MTQVDPDGAALKILSFKKTLSQYILPADQPSDTPLPYGMEQEASLPALRSGGLGLFMDDRALWLTNRLNNNYNYNKTLADDHFFHAGDLFRGYAWTCWIRTGSQYTTHSASGKENTISKMVDGSRWPRRKGM